MSTPGRGGDPTAEPPDRPSPPPGSSSYPTSNPDPYPDPTEAAPTTGDDAAAVPDWTGDAPRRGRISYQDETTVPREPTLAEKRAREQAARREQEAEDARWDEMERSAARRKKLLIGGSAVAGVAAVVAIGYALSRPDETQARCVDDRTGVVADDGNCVNPAASSGGYHSGGGFYPIFIGGGGRQYHYTYGGSGDVGQVATGGTTVPPSTGTARTSSGRTVGGSTFGSGSSSGSGDSAGSSSVSRGGFGVGGSGRSGGS